MLKVLNSIIKVLICMQQYYFRVWFKVFNFNKSGIELHRKGR